MLSESSMLVIGSKFLKEQHTSWWTGTVKGWYAKNVKDKILSKGRFSTTHFLPSTSHLPSHYEPMKGLVRLYLGQSSHI